MQEELHTSVVCYCYCFLATYLALASLNLLAQISDRIHHFTALKLVHLRGLGTDYADGLGATGSAGSLELTPKVLIAYTARPQSGRRGLC